MPKTIVTSVYNTEKYLPLCINSILPQLNPDDEWLVIDDASTDSSSKILTETPGINLIRNSENLKLPASLNKAIQMAKNKYIARMDADDICLPGRFDEQEKFLEKNPEIDIVGTAALIIDENGKKIRPYKAISDHLRIKWKMLFSNPMIHPSVMARAEVFKSNPYNTSFPNSQDYELWSRLMFEKGVKFANINRPLLLYRIHKSSTTANRDLEKNKLSLNISISNIKRYLNPGNTELDVYSSFRLGLKISLFELLILDRFYLRCYSAFVKKENLTIAKKIRIFLDLTKSFKFSAKQYIKGLIKRKA